MMLTAFIGVAIAVAATWYFVNKSLAKNSLDVNKDGKVDVEDAKAAVAEVKAEVKKEVKEVVAAVQQKKEEVVAAVKKPGRKKKNNG